MASPRGSLSAQASRCTIPTSICRPNRKGWPSRRIHSIYSATTCRPTLMPGQAFRGWGHGRNENSISSLWSPAPSPQEKRAGSWRSRMAAHHKRAAPRALNGSSGDRIVAPSSIACAASNRSKGSSWTAGRIPLRQICIHSASTNQFGRGRTTPQSEERGVIVPAAR